MSNANPAQEIRSNERAFHDEWADHTSPAAVLVDESFEACTAPENRIILSHVGDLAGKRVLDLGCGCGEGAVYFAKRGASAVAVDVSRGMLDLTEQVAKFHGVSVQTVEGVAWSVPLPDGSFDVVYAANLLHHVDVGATLKEARRLLKDGGIFASYDPIAYNPLINVYRRMATQVRTDDEHPLRVRDLSVVRQTFPEVRMEFTWFATLWLFMKFFLIDRINPNKDRYWKRVLREHVALESAYLALERIDKHMLKICPFMKWFCWNVVIIGRK